MIAGRPAFEASAAIAGRSNLRRYFASLALVFLAAAVSAAEMPATEREALFIVRQLIAGQRYDEAIDVVRRFRPQDKSHSLRVRLTEGLVLEAKGDYAGAAAVYRSILDRQPEVTAARVRLAEALAAGGDRKGAKHHLDQLIAAGVDDQLGGRLNALSNAVKESEPFRFSGAISLLPSTNVNSGTDNTTIVLGGIPLAIDPASRRKSGIGILASGEAVFRQRFAPTAVFTATMAASHRYYPSINLHQSNLDGVAAVTIDKGRWGYAPALIGGVSWANWQPSRRYAGAKIDGWTRVGDKMRLTGNVSALREYFTGNTAKDGWLVSFDGAADRFLTPASFVRILGGTSLKQAAQGRNSYTEGQIGLGFYREFSTGLSLYSEARYAHRAFRETGFGMSSPQRDNRVTASFVLTKRDLQFWGAAPQISYSYTRNFSNNLFEDTQKHDIDMRLTKAF